MEHTEQSGLCERMVQKIPRDKMKKLPADKVGREIFSEKSGQLVHLQSHAALLPGSGILVQDTLGDEIGRAHV